MNTVSDALNSHLDLSSCSSTFRPLLYDWWFLFVRVFDKNVISVVVLDVRFDSFANRTVFCGLGKLLGQVTFKFNVLLDLGRLFEAILDGHELWCCVLFWLYHWGEEYFFAFFRLSGKLSLDDSSVVFLNGSSQFISDLNCLVLPLLL